MRLGSHNEPAILITTILIITTITRLSLKSPPRTRFQIQSRRSEESQISRRSAAWFELESSSEQPFMLRRPGSSWGGFGALLKDFPSHDCPSS
ncbi:hypothetical protein Q7C36_023505 [Tachysurus vachellii]|uniref:Uncharacterized protein n=1 Tax=Tachysurus vachellii TaxID=175792 RepID=A0AA88IJQ0_TACVA|nr:hypothetical protein Q7C36_023505 [Tachysurus vachellii]